MITNEALLERINGCTAVCEGDELGACHGEPQCPDYTPTAFQFPMYGEVEQ